MENLKEMKERASKYSLAEIKRKVKGQKPFGRGMEGEVYQLENDLVVKFRRGIGAGYNQRTDNLAEFQRQSIHNYINEINGGKVSFTIINRSSNREQTLTAQALDILVCFADGKCSASITPFIEGETLPYDREVIGMSEALREVGIVIDDHGENVMPGYQFDTNYVVLETWSKLYPNSLKIIEKASPENKKRALEHLARAHIYGATSKYPIPHEEMTLPDGPMGMFSPITWHDVALVSAVNGHKEISHKNLEECLAHARHNLTAEQKRQMSSSGLSEYEWSVMGYYAIWQARAFFGKQFIPVPFDWENGSNLDVYGINPSVFNEFKQEVDKVKPEIQPTLEEAKKLMKQNNLKESF